MKNSLYIGMMDEFNEFGGGFSFFNIMEILFPIFFFAIFALIIGTIIYSIVDRAKDRKKPIIPVKARIVSKRTNVSHSSNHNSDGMSHSSTSTTYYVTFQFVNGERMELQIPSHQVGYLVEGDEGTLTFQGKLFVDFVKENDPFMGR